VKTGAGMTKKRKMSIFDRLRGKKEEVEKPKEKTAVVEAEKIIKTEKKSEKQTSKKVKAVKTEKPKKEIAKRKITKKDNNIAHKVLLENLISEKSTMLAAENKYVFKVHLKAGKFQIREAVEGYYGVQVVGVNTIRINPKKRIQGRTIGWKKGFKKAIVTLRQGDTIGAAEGV
jgi:large subunit ribosomal protein L23